MAFRVMERKWALSDYLNYGMKEAFYFTLENVKCYHCVTMSFLGRRELFLLELVLITWFSKPTVISDSSYSIFPLHAVSLPLSTSSLVDLTV